MIHRRAAFTIVELLVVTAIIALLTAILVPSVMRARESAKRTLCGTHLQELGRATTFYLDAEKKFPLLNNEPEDGHWQYNYVIWDGRDFEHNFGPLHARNLIPDPRILWCPTQESPYHQMNTFVNPWPPQELLDSRAGYGRRPMISGLDVTQLPARTALYADLFHTPNYVLSSHRSGVNVIFIDGGVRFVSNFKPLIENDMTLPTSLIDNPTMMKIWQELDAK